MPLCIVKQRDCPLFGGSLSELAPYSTFPPIFWCRCVRSSQLSVWVAYIARYCHRKFIACVEYIRHFNFWMPISRTTCSLAKLHTVLSASEVATASYTQWLCKHSICCSIRMSWVNHKDNSREQLHLLVYLSLEMRFRVLVIMCFMCSLKSEIGF